MAQKRRMKQLLLPASAPAGARRHEPGHMAAAADWPMTATASAMSCICESATTSKHCAQSTRRALGIEGGVEPSCSEVCLPANGSWLARTRWLRVGGCAGWRCTACCSIDC
jgi:hypothetical protein